MLTWLVLGVLLVGCQSHAPSPDWKPEPSAWWPIDPKATWLQPTEKAAIKNQAWDRLLEASTHYDALHRDCLQIEAYHQQGRVAEELVVLRRLEHRGVISAQDAIAILQRHPSISENMDFDPWIRLARPWHFQQSENHLRHECQMGQGEACLNFQANPQRLALLLPLKGPLSAAGRAFREGFLTGMLASGVKNVQVETFDTHQQDISDLEAKLKAHQADWVVGPMERRLIQNQALSQQPSLILGDLKNPKAPSYSFSISGLSEIPWMLSRLYFLKPSTIYLVSSQGAWHQQWASAFRQSAHQIPVQLLSIQDALPHDPDSAWVLNLTPKDLATFYQKHVTQWQEAPIMIAPSAIGKTATLLGITVFKTDAHHACHSLEKLRSASSDERFWAFGIDAWMWVQHQKLKNPATPPLLGCLGSERLEDARVVRMLQVSKEDR